MPNSSLCAPPVFSNFGATDVFTVDQRIRTPYIQNYNLNIQQQLASGVVLQIGYIGSAGRKLFRYRDVNQSVGGGPVPYPDFVYINQFESTANSNYQRAANNTPPADPRSDLERELYLVALHRHGQRRTGLCPQRQPAGQQL